MGIFGALQSAVSGLKAQSHAMENISGNIANSQTIGYKRIDTSFVDMIPDAPVKQQIAGAVSAYSRSMNTLRGDIQNAETETYMALNGNGFFVTEKADGSGGTFYTRRGDFDIDRNGYLVNGAGYRLTGLGMDNGVVTGSVAQAVKIDNAFLPAKRSTTINYQLNLPQTPKTSTYVSTTPGSELLKPWSYSGDVQGSPVAPKVNGKAVPAVVNGSALVPTDGSGPVSTQLPTIVDGSQLVLNVGGTPVTFTFDTNGTALPGEVNANGTVADLLASMQTQLRAVAGQSGAQVGIKNGQISIQLTPAATAQAMSITSGGAFLGLGPVTPGLDGPAVPTTAPAYGYGNIVTGSALASTVVGDTNSITITVGGTNRVLTFDTNAPAPAAGFGNVDATGDISTMLASMQAELRAMTGGNEVVGIKDGRIFVQGDPAGTATLSFSSTPTGLLGLSSVTAAVTSGNVTSANMPADLVAPSVHGQTLSITVGGVTRSYLLDATGDLTASSGVIKVDATGSLKEMLDVIQADLRSYGGPGASGATASWTAADGLTVDFPGNYRSNVNINGLGLNQAVTAATGTLSTISAANSELFVKESISGGGITVYSQTGEPVNVQMRWAKVSDEAGIATWSMFYASDSAPGATNAWTKLADYRFDQGVLSGVTGDNGVTVNGTERLSIPNLSVNGRSFGSLTIDHGLKGMTQFADNSGMASTTKFTQDGYGAGEFISVGVSDEGQVIASYTNGETRAVAQIITASFSNPNALKRGDGGAYTATTESGEPIIDQSGQGIVGSSTEASNTDISEEFTKLIVTQQAYSANTKIVTAADEMLQEALNMIR